VVGTSNKYLIERTQKWVLDVVVGLNFCPFAKPVVTADAINYKVVNEQKLDACLMALLDEINSLNNDASIETSLLIYPVGFEAFEDYLNLVEIAEALLVEEGLEGIYQLASFHPDYCFEGAKYDDAANYTNRSPYPMLHLLREESLEKALQSVASPEKIPARNIAVAREKGLAEMQALLDSSK